MPLKEGYSKHVVSQNIVELIKSGKPKKQAVKISLDAARRGMKKQKSKRDVAGVMMQMKRNK